MRMAATWALDASIDSLTIVPAASNAIARWSAAIANVAVDDRGVLADIDTPADYDAFVRDRGR